VTPQNVGHTNAELIWAHSLNFAPNLFEFSERDFPWPLWRQFWCPSLRKPPHNQTEQGQDDKCDYKNKPRRNQRIIHRRRDIMELFSEHEQRGSNRVMEYWFFEIGIHFVTPARSTRHCLSNPEAALAVF